MKGKVIKVKDLEPETVEKALNDWLVKVGSINLVKDYAIDGNLVFLFTQDFSRNLRRLEGEEPRCPKCNSSMKVRATKTGDLFWGCMKFPDCRGTQDLTDMDWEKLAGPGSSQSGGNGDIPF